MSTMNHRQLLDRAVREESQCRLKFPVGFWSEWTDAERLKWAATLYASELPPPFVPQYRSPRFERPTVRNLIYHVAPLKSNDLWRANVKQLFKRINVFNGRCVLAIATGEGMHPFDQVKREVDRFPGLEFLPLPGDPILREVASFLPLLLSVANTNANEATFYAHTKGNSTSYGVQGATYWRNAMYHHLLDRADECMEELETHVAAGCMKTVWNTQQQWYPSGLQHGGWMLAGTFFWFRNDAVFGHKAWRNIPMDRYGAEAWLSGMFAPHEAASMYQLWPENEWPSQNHYDPALHPNPIEDD